MLKMIIVDDEPLILENLSTLVNWESVGVQVVATTDNGAAAIDMTLKLKPDIIISDISMPYLNGLEMLDNLRRNSVRAEVIFISAYSRFEYAQQALKNGAFDYILKPIQEDLILETVQRCVDAINRKRGAQPLAKLSDDNYAEDFFVCLLKEGRAPTVKEIVELKTNAANAKLCELLIGIGDSIRSPIPPMDETYDSLIKQVKNGDTEDITCTLYSMFLLKANDEHLYDLHDTKLWLIELADSALKRIEGQLPLGWAAEDDRWRKLRREIAAQTQLHTVFCETATLFLTLAQQLHNMQQHTTTRLIQQAIQYIQANYQNDLTLADVAGQLYVSPAYLSKVFSAEMNEPFSHYLQALRIGQAKNLLRQSNMKIYQVAAAVGYGDIPHFSKSFKQITGLSPNQFRKQG